jgi:nucleoside-diphosphate-sugar epimerase
MKAVTVTGAGGFIGHHLVKYLKRKEYYVIGVDIKYPYFEDTMADEFRILDLRKGADCDRAVMFYDNRIQKSVDEIYHLAADMGGVGYITDTECDIMRNSSLININMLHSAYRRRIDKFFFSSSVCVYPDMNIDDKTMREEDVYPANPDNEYGWSKLYAERLVQAYGRNTSMKTRIARFQNCYGPFGEYTGGKEKAPAALCRKVAIARSGDNIEVWGDGTALRSYIYVDDLVDAIYKVMNCDLNDPFNIGNDICHTVTELAEIIITASEKKLGIKYIDGPVGVKNRNFSNKKIKKIGWSNQTSLEEGIKITYKWIKKQTRGLAFLSLENH